MEHHGNVFEQSHGLLNILNHRMKERNLFFPDFTDDLTNLILRLP
jgi:hypothetical protein